MGKTEKLPSTILLNYHQHGEYSYRLLCGKYGYNRFNLGSNSRSKCPSISCTSFTSREDLEIEISPIIVPYRSTPPPFFVDGNCVDGNWLPTVLGASYNLTLAALGKKHKKAARGVRFKSGLASWVKSCSSACNNNDWWISSLIWYISTCNIETCSSKFCYSRLLSIYS